MAKRPSRLPAAPFVAWMREKGVTAHTFGRAGRIDGSVYRKLMKGEQLTVALQVADEVCIAHGAHLSEVYPWD